MILLVHVAFYCIEVAVPTSTITFVLHENKNLYLVNFLICMRDHLGGRHFGNNLPKGRKL